MATEIEVLGRVTTGAILEACRTVTLAYAQSVQGILLTDKPPPPAPGSMQFVSARQRKFVMANIRKGSITVPYVRGRGNKLRGSQSLSQSYRTNLAGDEAVLTSSASYANYVVGDQQAPIHQGRWTTARQAAEQMKQSGDLQYIVDKVFAEVQ